MRFLETLLIVIAAVYLAQLAIMSLMIVTVILFLWCLYVRPKEALLLGMGVLLIAFLSTRAGLALILIAGICIAVWALIRRLKARRPALLLTYRSDVNADG